MCDFHEHALPHLEHDEWVLDTPLIRGFIDSVRAAVGRCVDIRCRGLSARRAGLQGSSDAVRLAAEAVSAGRAGERDGRRHRPVASLPRRRPLALPLQPRRAAGSTTPVHDHLAWGLVGLYKGTQDEEFYEPGDGRLELIRQRPLGRATITCCCPGRRRPPRTDDVRRDLGVDPPARERHRLRARHTFDDQTGEARPFRSGYVNADCRREASAARDGAAQR